MESSTVFIQVNEICAAEYGSAARVAYPLNKLLIHAFVTNTWNGTYHSYVHTKFAYECMELLIVSSWFRSLHLIACGGCCERNFKNNTKPIEIILLNFHFEFSHFHELDEHRKEHHHSVMSIIPLLGCDNFVQLDPFQISRIPKQKLLMNNNTIICYENAESYYYCTK